MPGLFSDSILFLEEILLPLFQVHCQTQKQRKVEFNKEGKLIIFIQLGYLVVLLVSSENLAIKSLHEKKWFTSLETQIMYRKAVVIYLG